MQHKDENAAEYLSRIASNMAFEKTDLLAELPTIASIVEYFELWAKYDSEYLEGIIEGIEYHGDDPKPFQEFCKKYNLKWSDGVKAQANE